MGRLLALAVALIAAALVAWVNERPPAAQPADAALSVFSAMRTMADVEVIAARPHPVGSAANQAVRDHLMRRMTELGLSPQIRRGSAIEVSPDAVAGASVENVVGVLPGRDRGKPALVLMAHYDSVPGSPGAADDAAGTASALEVIRAIAARGRPERDVMVLITDGEEAGLFGAGAFFARDPLAGHVGFVINMEARGNGGRVQMFETGRQNGAAIDLFRRTAHRPSASSLSGFIYAHMPNGTDFTEAKTRGAPGLNYAFLGQQFDYHSPTSTPATVDKSSLQDMGDQVLGVAEAIATAPALPARRADAVYGATFGDLVVAYPAWGGWLVLAAAGGLIALGVRRARKLEGFAWLDVARGAAALLFSTIGGVAVLHFARKATGAEVGYLAQRFLLAQAVHWEAAMLLLGMGFLLFAAASAARGRRIAALLPLAAGLASSAFGGFDALGLGLGLAAALLGLAACERPVSRAGAWAGVLALGWLVTLSLQIAAPTTAYVFGWPLLLAALAAAGTSLAARRGPASLVLLALAAIVGLVWIAGLAHVAFLSLDLAELMALPLMLAAFGLWPLAQPDEGAPPARLVGPTLLVCGAAMLAAVRLADPWTPRHPQVTQVFYRVDQDSGRAWRISTRPEHLAWTEAVLSADGGAPAPARHWSLPNPFRAAPARMIAEAAPTLTLTREADGRLRLHAVPPPGARILDLQLQPDTAASAEQFAELAMRVVLKPGRWTPIRWYAAPAGVDILIRPGGPGAIDVRYAAIQERWPAGAAALPSRPATAMPFDLSDSTLVTGSRRFTW